MIRSIFILKLFLDAVRDSFKVYNYFKLYKFNNRLIILKLFIIKFLYAFPVIRNQRKVLKNIKDEKCKYFLNENPKISSLVKDVDIYGFSKILYFKKKYLNQITKFVLDSNNLIIKENFSNKNELYKHNNEDLEKYFLRLKKKNISRLTASINIKKESVLKDFLFSEFMIEFAKSYLNTKDLSVNATLFISNPLKISEQQKYKNAQYFHWDNDFKKFFKFYIYLSDVDKNSGPHIYIPNTHKIKSFPFRLCRLYSDEKIYKNFTNPKIFIGKSGSSFFSDSYGIHKGETPNLKSRLILNVHYGTGKILYSENDSYLKLN